MPRTQLTDLTMEDRWRLARAADAGVRPVIGLDIGRAGRVTTTGIPDRPYGIFTPGPDSVEDTVFIPYLTRVQRQSDSARGDTLRTYASKLLIFARFFACLGIPLRDVTEGDYVDFIGWLVGDVRVSTSKARTGRASKSTPCTGGYSSSFINNVDSIVFGFYEFWSRHEDSLMINPVPRRDLQGISTWSVKGSEIGRPRVRASELRRKRPPVIINPLPENVVSDLKGALLNSRDRALFELFETSALRASEAVYMTVADIQESRRRVSVITKGLGGAKREVPASPEFFSLARQYLRDCADRGLILRAPDRLWWTLDSDPAPMKYSTLDALGRRMEKRSGQPFRWHALRHTTATGMRKRGMPVEVVQEFLGHRSMESTMIYAAVTIDDVIDHYSGWLDAEPEDVTPIHLNYDQDDLDVLLGGQS